MQRSQEPFDSLLKKLMTAGWVAQIGSINKKDGTNLKGIAWTEEGLTATSAISILIEDLERRSTKLTRVELLLLHEIIRKQQPFRE